MLRTVVLRKTLVDTRATGCNTQQLSLYFGIWEDAENDLRVLRVKRWEQKANDIE
jgi:hypothetical protein